MATTKLTSKVFTGAYNTQWAAKETAILDTKYLPDVYSVYGDLVKPKLSVLLNLAGRVMDVPNATIYHFEKYSPNFSITTATAISTGSAGADITFKIATTDYDSNNKPPLRNNDTIEIPYTYMPAGINEDRLYFITGSSGSGTDLTFTARPFLKDGTNKTASQIGTEVPIGTTLRIGHNTWQRGGGQPTAKTDSWATKSHSATILAESGQYEGGQMAQAFEEAILVDMKRGGQGILMDPILEIGERLDSQEESYILTGEENDNTNLTGTSQAGSYSTSIVSGYGYLKTADRYSQESYHDGELEMSDLYRKELLLRTQGLRPKKVYIICGPEYNNMFERAGLEHLQRYSSTDIVDAAGTIGINFAHYLIAGIEFCPVVLDSLANPSTLGINVGDAYSYAYPDMGWYVPDVQNQVKMNGKTFSCPNLMIGYVNQNGENRRRMVGIKAGVNGVQDLIPSNFVASEYDMFDVYMKTEVMAIGVNANQWILDRKSK